MFEKLVYAGIVFAGFSAIMNPITGISIFLALTKNDTDDKVKIIAFQSTMTAFIVVVFFALSGHFLLNFFRVSFTALRLTGGVLMALIGHEMLQGKPSPFNRPLKSKTEEEASIGITPLGVPLLAGPGVIITAINFAAGNFVNFVITIFSFGLLCAITYFVLVSGKKIKKALGVNALSVITKMMGLILAVIGMQMLIDGVYSAIKEFQNVQFF